MEAADAVADFGPANFLEAKEEVEKALWHPSEIVRYNAMATLAYEWGVCSSTERLLEILRGDRDDDCRRQAAGALGALFRNSRDARIADALLGVVEDGSESKHVRAFAFTGLLDVLGIPLHEQPNPVGLEVDEQTMTKARSLVSATLDKGLG
jgi:hypothetical protein